MTIRDPLSFEIECRLNQSLSQSPTLHEVNVKSNSMIARISNRHSKTCEASSFIEMIFTQQRIRCLFRSVNERQQHEIGAFAAE